MTDTLIVALDLPEVPAARALAGRLHGAVSFYKIGLQLLPIGGMDLAVELKEGGAKTFLDFKFHDIPATVEKATRTVTRARADFLTVHAEPPVMRAAVQGRDGDPHLKILGVTVLTSYDDAMLAEMGYACGARDLVLRRAEQAIKCGADGVIASAQEAAEIRKRFGNALLIVTPGIRPVWSAKDDQSRVVTPADAIRAGADHIVVGRPVNAAADPAAAARAINEEIAAAR
ncbi:MAG: orotidine-5'-phosphate decarboxylase [Maricaulaceae bacterium]|nr:orotidine-5'-phosphate decarboxylase [Maricaulaceae bacterium]